MAAEKYEVLVGLDVRDEEGYTRYRAGMTPILEEYGGTFRYDFRIGETLRSATSDRINRLFILSFPDEETQELFFADPAYRAVKAEFFQPAVASVTEIARFTYSPA